MTRRTCPAAGTDGSPVAGLSGASAAGAGDVAGLEVRGEFAVRPRAGCARVAPTPTPSPTPSPGPASG